MGIYYFFYLTLYSLLTKLLHQFVSVSVPVYQGEVLKLVKVSRSEMGTYLCIASNGVPPTISKRITLNVHCKFLPNIIRIFNTTRTYHTL